MPLLAAFGNKNVGTPFPGKGTPQRVLERNRHPKQVSRAGKGFRGSPGSPAQASACGQPGQTLSDRRGSVMWEILAQRGPRSPRDQERARFEEGCEKAKAMVQKPPALSAQVTPGCQNRHPP